MSKASISRFLSGLVCFVLGGCATSPSVTNKPVDEYIAFQKDHPGANLQGAKEAKAKTGFASFLSNLTAENIRENTQKTYAPQLYFNDTLKVLHSSSEVEEYFLKTVEGVDMLNATIVDVARSGNDYYFRWVMEMKLKALQRGQTIRSVGMSHVRFDSEGRVILHQDYWDSASGLFQHVPVIGGGIELIKKRL